MFKLIEFWLRYLGSKTNDVILKNSSKLIKIDENNMKALLFVTKIILVAFGDINVNKNQLRGQWDALDVVLESSGQAVFKTVPGFAFRGTHEGDTEGLHCWCWRSSCPPLYIFPYETHGVVLLLFHIIQ